jgi:hypothetical protein
MSPILGPQCGDDVPPGAPDGRCPLRRFPTVLARRSAGTSDQDVEEDRDDETYDARLDRYDRVVLFIHTASKAPLSPAVPAPECASNLEVDYEKANESHDASSRDAARPASG